MSDKPNPAVTAAAAQAAAAPNANVGAPPPEDERPVWAGNPSWKAYYINFVLMGLWLAALGALVYFVPFLRGATTDVNGYTAFQTVGPAISAVLLLLGWGYLFLSAIIGRYSISYRLTTQRLFLEKGLLGRTVDQTELVRVEDVQYKQSLLQRIFGIGDVHILAHDLTDGEVIIRDIDGPSQVAESVRTYTQKRRARSVYVENV